MVVILTILSPAGRRRVKLSSGRITIGRGDAAGVVIDDPGLSRVHSSIHCDGDRVWVLDEASTNGTYVDGKAVAPAGTPLVDGARIEIGNETSIIVEIQAFEGAGESKPIERPGGTSKLEDRSAGTAKDWGVFAKAPPAPVVISLILLIAVLIGLAARGHRAEPAGAVTEPSRLAGSSEALASAAPGATRDATGVGDSGAPGQPIQRGLMASSTVRGLDPAMPRVLYQKLTPAEQQDYVAREAEHIASMIGQRPCTFTPEVLGLIKYWVDAYAKRVGNGQKGLWREDLRTVFNRAASYTPIVTREFRKRQINDVVGVYIPMIETEYNNICSENKAGAMGLFQFTAATAQSLGVSPADRCDVEKMAPIAARYIADRISEFGTDAVGVSLSIAGYNRSPDSVRRDLYNVLDPDNRERSFWTLVANKARLDHWFQDENVSYVPRFFAAAIVGENPWDFGIDMRQLSTYTEPIDRG